MSERKRGGRLYLRIDPSLKEQVQEYCDKKHTSVSDLVTRFLVRVMEEEEKQRRSADEPRQI